MTFKGKGLFQLKKPKGKKTKKPDNITYFNVYTKKLSIKSTKSQYLLIIELSFVV